MTDDNYAVVFDGTLEAGAERSAVQANLAALFKLPAAKIERLFVGKPVTVKKGLTNRAAQQLVQVFSKAGAVAKVIRLGVMAGTPEEALTANTLAHHFAGSFERRQPALTYRLGLVITALFMLLLPALYLALISAFAVAPFWYLTHVPAPHRPSPYLWLFYVTPVVAAVAVAFFLVKPLFAPRAVRRLPVELSAAKEPLFFTFVYAIADKVGAPRPRTIEVDCEVNASAGFYRGFRGLLHNHLTLVVGLPLVAAMDTRQLAGVIAHEFGHFSQRGGMFASYLVRRINQWFYRAVNERDQWDGRLEQWAEAETFFSLAATVARLGVWLVRRVLAAFLWSAEVTSYYMLRQMEFDADTYEARLAGSALFRETSLRLRRLAYASHAAYEDLGELWNRRQLVDDFPAMVARKCKELPREALQQIEEELQETRQDVFATHPPDESRVRHAEALMAAGVFTLQRPAQLLFKDYKALARQASLRFYRNLGLEVKEDQLVAKETMASAVALAKQQDQALHEYCRGLFLAFRFLPPPDMSPHLSLDDDARKTRLNEVVAKLRQALPEMDKLRVEFEQLADQLAGAYARQVLSQQKSLMVQSLAQEISSKDFGSLQQALARVKARFAPLDALLSERMGIALGGAIQSPAVRPEDKARLEPALKLIQLIHTLQTARDELYLQGGILFYGMRAADRIRHSNGESIPDGFFEFWRRNSAASISNLISALDSVPYPFERAGGDASVFAHMRERLPPRGSSLSEHYLYIGPFIGELQNQYTHVMRFIAALALHYETAVGVTPLSIRPPKT